MEGIKDNDESDSNLEPKADKGITRKFLIEIVGKFNSTSTIEVSNYDEALELFNQKSKEGKNLILYEVHTSLRNGSTVKKVPVLNTSKHAERMRELEEKLKNSSPETKGTDNAPIPTSSASPQNEKSKTTLGSMKYKIIILAAIVAGFIVTLFMLDIIAGAGSGDMSGHSIALETLQTYFQITTTNISSDHNHQVLF
jgi:hypothetical protein